MCGNENLRINLKKGASFSSTSSIVMAFLSDLPEELVIHCILPRIRDARCLASLSAVSRSWNRVASFAPSMDLAFPGSWRRESARRSTSAAEIAVATISRMQRGSIEQLRIAFCPSEFRLASMREEALGACIHLVSSSVQELRLSNRGCSYSDLLPCFSRCPKLASISLESGYFDGVPRDMPPLCKLASCSFTGVIFRGSDLEAFVAKCPALEELLLDRCFSTDNQVNLHSSSVTRLRIIDCSLARTEIRMSKLARLELQQVRGDVHVVGGQIAELSIDLACARHEHCFSGDSIRKLAFLAVNGRGWTSERFLGLLNLATNLGELKIMKHFSTKDEIPGHQMLKIVERFWQTAAAHGMLVS